MNDEQYGNIMGKLGAMEEWMKNHDKTHDSTSTFRQLLSATALGAVVTGVIEWGTAKFRGH